MTNVANASDGNWAAFGAGLRAHEGGEPDEVVDTTPNGINAGDGVLFMYADGAWTRHTQHALCISGSDRKLYRSTDRGTNMSVVSQAPLVSGVPVSAIRNLAAKGDRTHCASSDWRKRQGLRHDDRLECDDRCDRCDSCSIHRARAIVDPNNILIAYVTLDGFNLAAGQHHLENNQLQLGHADVDGKRQRHSRRCVPINALVIDPRNSNHLYAGTDAGVYNSTDGGTNWQPYGLGLPKASVFDMAIQNPLPKIPARRDPWPGHV